MADFILRPALKTDEDAIKRLVRSSRINPLGLDWRRFVLLVDSAGKLIACGQIKPHSDGSRELASLAVRRNFRGQGLARRIIEHLLAENPDSLYLTCRSALEPFYVKFGFRAISREEMPPYFRRLSLLAKVLIKFARPGEHLAVMKRG